ncbi:uncharacterized protein LOC144917075 [Branchiostoma floridae x Branchiostoma belcheri]
MSSVSCPAFRHSLTTTANGRQRQSRIYLTGWKLEHLIFFTCLLVVAFMPATVKAANTCKEWEYLDGGRCKICPNRRCEAGQRLVRPCGSGQDMVCEDCSPLAEGYTCVNGVEQTCVLCDVQGKKTVRPCNRFSQTVCGGCLEGYFAVATTNNKVHCLHCDEDRANNSDCPVKVEVKKETPAPETAEEVSRKQTHHLDSTATYAMVAGSLAFGAVMFLLLVTVVLSARYGLGQKIKDKLKRRNNPQLSNSLDPETGSGTCISKNGAHEMTRETSGPSSGESRREDNVGYHQEYLVAQPASASVRATPDFPWPVPDSSNANQKLVDKSETPEEPQGTSSPFNVTEDEEGREGEVFVFPEITRTVSESSEGPPSSPVVVLAGQTAQVHKSTKKTRGSNQTANLYKTKLAKYLQRAHEIPLRDEWFNYDRQQHLSAQLDRIPPAASLPNWRTFFETLGHLEKLDMDSVNNRRVESPTLALFNVLETRNVENMLTVGHVLEALVKTKFAGLVDYLCEEIKNTPDVSEPSQV